MIVWLIRFRPKDSIEWDWLSADGGRAYGDVKKAGGFPAHTIDFMLDKFRRDNPGLEFKKFRHGPGALKVEEIK
jgi:hypothetical protein